MIYMMRFFSIVFFCGFVQAQTLSLGLPESLEIEVENLHGRVIVLGKEGIQQASLTVESDKFISEKEIKLSRKKKSVQIFVIPEAEKRIDLTLQIPAGLSVKVRTGRGEIRFSGYFKSCEARTETGTISTDVPVERLEYSFLWASSYPRFLSAIQLEEIREKPGGRFLISGKIGEKKRKAGEEDSENYWTKLDFKTERGIILFNVHPAEAPPDLRERPLTEAAKAIIRSGDSFLMEAIRRVSPKYFGDYAKTLPPRKAEPSLKRRDDEEKLNKPNLRQVTVRVLDSQGRAIAGLQKNDFLVLEKGVEREIISVGPVKTSVNLVLLLDVSGSVENYIDFIRRTAKAFVDTMDEEDRISIVVFNDDVQVLCDFTTDRVKLSKSINEFDAGGATALYDALAYTLVEILRPFRNSRKAVVLISDGDDNRSFLSFNDLIPTIQESGTLIYPLYVPSSLIVFSLQSDPSKAVDPVWTKYMSLTSKAEEEGKILAEVSGGIYYPISRLEQIQKAYEDIAVQLRSAYTVTFRSSTNASQGTRDPNLKVKVLREGSFVTIEEVKAGG